MFQKKRVKSKIFPRLTSLSLAIMLLLAGIRTTSAQSPQSLPATASSIIDPNLKVGLDTLWVIFTGCLVFFMNGGFAMLEAGFCRQKNTVNILSKNLIVFALTTVTFWAIGFGLMFGNGTPLFGLNGFFLKGIDNSPSIGEAYQGVFESLSWTSIPLKAKFFFQLAFAGVAATIVSGAVAERLKFLAFFLFTLFLAGISYPITGHWIWGGGWLSQLGFWDFAGGTVVHAVGGWAALVGTLLLGPRIGKYQEGISLALPGHNLTVATLGCLILWLGWFGFNSGSVMAFDSQIIAHVLLTTNMAAAMGAIGATLTAWSYFGKPDLSVMINGILGGLVSITAACRFVTIGWAGVIGLVGGVIVVFALDFFDQVKIDDPVGAISVHLVGGIWGTLAVGLFALGPNVSVNSNFILYLGGPHKGLLLGGGLMGLEQLLIQLLGLMAVSCFTVIMSWLAWSLIWMAVGLRVSLEAELKGLDVSEHGLQAYSGFFLKQDVNQKASGNISERQNPPSNFR